MARPQYLYPSRRRCEEIVDRGCKSTRHFIPPRDPPPTLSIVSEEERDILNISLPEHKAPEPVQLKKRKKKAVSFPKRQRSVSFRKLQLKAPFGLSCYGYKTWEISVPGRMAQYVVNAGARDAEIDANMLLS